ncbi:MAG: fused MFS/spermidine synthase [Acidimicrobiales bacterium]
MKTEASPDRTLPGPLADGLVFITSFVVLVLEIVAGRLLAPYVGVTLETFTTIIGVVLAGIAVGTWGGGTLADRTPPRRLLGPMLVGGGMLTFLVIPVIRVVGPAVGPNSIVGLMMLTFLGLFVPAAMLSAVSPTVVKLQLLDLESTGATVGRFSALGTAGALFGSFMTGFVFVARVSSTTIVVGVGILITLLGLVVWTMLGRSQRSLAGTTVAALALATVFNYSLTGPCQVESHYFCARVVADEEGGSGRFLILDTLRHSFVDLEDPTHLEFDYSLSFADVIQVSFPEQRPVTALHIGGGGFTFPRWIAAEYPGSESLVLELDATLVELVQNEMGLVLSDDLRVRTGDARTGLLDQPDDRYDVVLGDAFGGLAVPWHLTTVEFTREVDRVMTDNGIYLINLIDYPPLSFARAEVATLRAVFEHVAVVSSPTKFDADAGGNLVLVASHQPIDAAAIDVLARSRNDDDVAHVDAALDEWIGDAQILTDEFAPVDQLLTTP